MNFQTLTLVISVLGMFVLLICLLLLFTGRAEKLGQPQKIRGLGLDLEVSALGLIVLVGFIMALSSIYFQVRSFEKQLAAAEGESLALKGALAQAGRMSINLLVTLDGADSPSHFPKLDDVYCRYFVRDREREEWIEGAKVTSGIRGDQLRVTIEGITPQVYIERLELIDRNPKTARTWVKDPLGNPLSPSLTLKKIE
jgi:hypothetical protein